MDTYETYREELARSLAPLTAGQQYFFGCWCVEQLLGIFKVEETGKITATDQEQISKAMTFIWGSYTSFPDNSQRELFDVFAAVQEIEQKDFDQDQYPEYVAQALLVAQLLVLSFLDEHDAELILDVAETHIQVMEFSIGHNFGHDTTALFEHPLIRNELDLQTRLIETLATGATLTAADKRLLRPPDSGD